MELIPLSITATPTAFPSAPFAHARLALTAGGAYSKEVAESLRSGVTNSTSGLSASKLRSLACTDITDDRIEVSVSLCLALLASRR